MPAASRVSQKDAIDLIIKYIDHFRTDDLPKYSSDVWEQMSRDTKGNWSAECVYTNVRNDRREILTEARKIMKITIPINQGKNFLSPEESESSQTENNSDDSVSKSVALEEEIFDLVLTEEEWVAMKPEDGESAAQTSSENKKPRLKPGVWTNIIAEAFWLQYRMPCAFVFKRADIALSSFGDSYTIKIRGKCKCPSCRNDFHGYAEKKLDEKGITIQVKTRDTRVFPHKIVKRPLNGLRRETVKKELKNEGSSVWRKRYARENMRSGETEPSQLPCEDVVRQARKEAIDDQYGVKKSDGQDIIKTIKNISQTPEYYGFIRDLALDPFFVFYKTPAQLHAYKEYCRLHKKNSSIKLDATGSVVRKFHHEDGTRCAHIFLYSVVINFEGTTICVEQMLSEQHNEPFVEYWLKKWMLSGAPCPNEAVCDYSRTLLSALCHAFNGESLKKYIAKRFDAMMNDLSKTARPVTLCRIDVAHIMRAVSQWPCFHKRALLEVKEFYLFCVGLLIDCKTLSDFEEILTLICVVALQKYDNGGINLKEAKTTKEARQKLEDLIADRNISVKVQTANQCESQTKNECKAQKKEINEPVDNDSDTSSDTGSRLNAWLDEIVSKAKETTHEGKDLNAFYQPMFLESLVKLCRVFPLWSSVGLGYNAFRASSSHVEGYFNDLKTRVFAGSLPLRVDKFIKRHLDDIKGATLLFSSNIIAFRDAQASESKITEPGATVIEDIVNNIIEITPNDSSQHQICQEKGSIECFPADRDFPHNISCNIEITDLIEEHDESGLKSFENWRGKASEERHARQRFNDSNEVLSDDLIEIDSTTVVEEENKTSTGVTGFHKHDHSYSKSEELENTKLDDTHDNSTLETQQLTSSLKEERNSKDNSKRKTATADIDDISNAKKKGKYFNSYPEIRQRNKLLGTSKKPSLLLNGLICPQVKMDAKSYFIQNTCAFDSIVHILMMAGIDSTQYVQFLKNSTNATLQFVHRLIEEGVKTATFVNRARILQKMAKVDILMKTNERVISYKIDATMNIANMMQNLLASAPSILKTIICPNCGIYPSSSVSIAPNHWMISRQGFGALEKALGLHVTLFNVSCQNAGCTAKTTVTSETNEHVFIELDIRASVKSSEGLHCMLNDMPYQLQFQQPKQNIIYNYTLAGMVAYLPGHYVAYCRRSTGHWELLNDMNDKSRSIIACKSNTDNEPHYAVYIRSN